MSEIETKRCWDCKRDNPLDDFYADKRKPDGRQGRCKLCAHEYQQKYAKDRRTNNGDQVSGYRHSYRILNIEQILLSAAKIRARKEGTPLTVVKEDLVVPETCPVLGIPIVVGQTKRSDNSPTVDRIHSGFGYIKGNVAVISYRANRIKNDGSAEEHRKVVEWIKNHELHAVREGLTYNHEPEKSLRTMVLDAKKRAKKTGILFELDSHLLKFPSICPVLGIKLQGGTRGNRGNRDSSPSIDRVVPERGYVWGNVGVISWRANRIKNNGTAEEHLKIADWMDSMIQSEKLETNYEEVPSDSSGV